MYKNLNPDALSIAGRQSELIELTLTHGFRGFDLDLEQFQRQVEQSSLEHASRFIKSAPVIIGPFDLPFNWLGDDASFTHALNENRSLFATAQAVGSRVCRVTILPSDPLRPYHENFEFHRTRIAQLANALAEYEIRLGLNFQAPPKLRESQPHPFISTPDALLTLLKTTDSDNVGLVFDAWHWHVGGGTEDQLQDLQAEQVVEIRLAELDADTDIDQVALEDRLMPGATGVVKPLRFLNVMSELGFEGPVTPCPHPDQFFGHKREEVVRKAADATEKLIQSIGKEIDSEDTETNESESDSYATADSN